MTVIPRTALSYFVILQGHTYCLSTTVGACSLDEVAISVFPLLHHFCGPCSVLPSRTIKEVRVICPFLYTNAILLQEGSEVGFVVWSHVMEGEQIPAVRYMVSSS